MSAPRSLRLWTARVIAMQISEANSVFNVIPRLNSEKPQAPKGLPVAFQ